MPVTLRAYAGGKISGLLPLRKYSFLPQYYAFLSLLVNAHQSPANVSSSGVPWLAGGGLILATLAVYQNSFAGPFVFDDVPAIAGNPSIRQLWPVSGVLAPGLDGGLTVSGRPLVNLSLAINYALGGDTVWGYHLFNLLVHVLAGLALFGIARRTWLQPRLAARFGTAAFPLGLLVAVIWLLHPLQTESVTYVVQRAESLMGLCYLMTLYGFIRSTESHSKKGSPSTGSGHSPPEGMVCHARRPQAGVEWLWLSFVACLLGMAAKEVMVSAPLLVFLYDRTFVAGSFTEAWRRRWRYYLGLAGTWLLLAWLVAGTTGRGGTAGFGTVVGPWSYLLTQCQAIMHYLWLVIWPQPLVFDYGTATVGQLGEVWPQALLLVTLAAGTLWAVARRPGWGFAGACFFLILGPSSSLVPVASQTMAEHRMYLPLIVPVMLTVGGLYVWLGRRSFLVCGVLAAGCGGLTLLRNADYRSELALWTDTVAKRPTNGRAHNNLGKAVFATGRPAEAVAHYQAAIRLQPAAPEPYYNLGLALARLNRSDEAINHYQAALRRQPKYPEAHNNLGNSLLATGRRDEAGAHYEEALRLKPGWAEAHSNLANVRLELGRTTEAIQHGEEAVRLDPGYAEGYYNLGNALAQAGRLPVALTHYEAALRLRPDYADVANNLGNVLVELGRLPEAIARYEQALQLKPDYADPHRNLAAVLAHLGRGPEAIAHLRVLVQLRPEDQDAREELARLQALARP
jgi:tetratricopeptide (TPR) repeat protein